MIFIGFSLEGDIVSAILCVIITWSQGEKEELYMAKKERVFKDTHSKAAQ